MRAGKSLNILCVDDHQVVRDGVQTILSQQGVPAAVESATTAEEAVRLAGGREWDLVILDISLGAGRSGLDALREMRRLRPRLRVLVFSMHDDELYARRAVAAGAQGYVTKGSSSEELYTAIRAVIGGGRYITPEMAEKLVFAPPPEGLPHDRLSATEMRVMLMLASGLRNKEIAAELHVESSTVTTHRRRLLDKMGMETDAELNRYAREHKLLD